MLMISNPKWIFLALLFLIYSIRDFKNFKAKRQQNPIIAIQKGRSILWELQYKDGKTQKIRLSSYYRSRVFIILIYRPVDLPRYAPLVLPVDALSTADYQKLASLLWPG